MELWKSVTGFPGYEISDAGSIRSYRRGRLHILRPRKVGSGYLQVILYSGTVVTKKQKYIAVLVASEFLGKPDLGCEVNHRDGNKCNNHVSNLEWVTHRANMIHANRTGLRKAPKGERSANAKLTAAAVRRIRSSSLPDKYWAIRLGVSKTTIRHARVSKTWKYI